MLEFLKRKKKCCLCESAFGTLSEIEWYGHYNNKKWHFHRNCLSKVLGNPEQYSHLTVDKAIDISERIIEVQKIREEQNAKIGKLQVKLLGMSEI